MNQLPSEIFLLWSVSFLIKLSCKKLPPSLIKCVFLLLQCTPVRSKCPTSIQISFVWTFDEAKSWTSKSDSIVFNSLGCKFFCLSGEIQLASVSATCPSVPFRRQHYMYTWPTLIYKLPWCTAATNFKQRRCLSQSTGTSPTSWRFPP